MKNVKNPLRPEFPSPTSHATNVSCPQFGFWVSLALLPAPASAAGYVEELSSGTRPCSINPPSSGTLNTAQSPVWPKLNSCREHIRAVSPCAVAAFCAAWKHFPGGSAGPGTQANNPSYCWEQQSSPSFHRTRDITLIPFTVCYSRERGLSAGDGSIAEVTSTLLALPQPRDKRFLLFTPQTPVNIYCIVLNA